MTRGEIWLAEVPFGHLDVGLDRPSVVNCDGLYTIPQATLTRRIGALDEGVMGRVCSAVSYALGCLVERPTGLNPRG